jgi:hypothetical protein
MNIRRILIDESEKSRILEMHSGKKHLINEQRDAKCKNKNPYDALTGGGLNWKEERQKWINAKCNGTTPCILGDAATNINLRNAYCDGTWPPKKDVVQTPEQIEACKSKCAAVPLQPGQVGPQVRGWFFSRDRVCYEATGTGGFASKAECEACKCGTQGTIPGGDGGQKPGEGGTLPGGDKKPGEGGTLPGGDGGQKPGEGGNLPGGDGGQKLPDFIPPTIVKPSKPLD